MSMSSPYVIVVDCSRVWEHKAARPEGSVSRCSVMAGYLGVTVEWCSRKPTLKAAWHEPTRRPVRSAGPCGEAAIKCTLFPVFTALHRMQSRYSDGNSVCLSVCPCLCPSVRPSVCQTCALWQNGRKIYLDFYTIRKIIYHSFLRRKMVGGGRPLLPEILGQPARVGAKSLILNR